jgi:hypothetical protein
MLLVARGEGTESNRSLAPSPSTPTAKYVTSGLAPDASLSAELAAHATLATKRPLLGPASIGWIAPVSIAPLINALEDTSVSGAMVRAATDECSRLADHSCHAIMKCLALYNVSSLGRHFGCPVLDYRRKSASIPRRRINPASSKRSLIERERFQNEIAMDATSCARLDVQHGSYAGIEYLKEGDPDAAAPPHNYVVFHFLESRSTFCSLINELTR